MDDHRFIEQFKKVIDFGKKHPFSKDESLNEYVDKDKDAEVSYEKLSEYTKKLAKMIDELFETGATYKIFGAYEPTVDLIADFIFQLEPFVSKGEKIGSAK